MVVSDAHSSGGRPKIYTVPVKAAARVVAEASPLISSWKLCEAVGLDGRQLSDPGGNITYEQLVELFETAARLTKQPAFGLRVGARTDLRAFDIFGYIIMNSSTLKEVLNNAVRYFPLWTNGALFRTEQEGTAMRLIWEYVDPSVANCRQDCEMTLSSATKICRALLQDCAPREVHFQHSAPRHSSEHRRHFGTAVYFRMPLNQLIFDSKVLETPLRNADHGLCKLLVSYADDLLAHSGRRLSFIQRTQMEVRRHLLNGEARLRKVASSMGISARTLQRQLKTQGVSFRGLLDNLRQELAHKYLCDPEIEIGEIASLLGYAEGSEFCRAFRGWTGTTPRQYRGYCRIRTDS